MAKFDPGCYIENGIFQLSCELIVATAIIMVNVKSNHLYVFCDYLAHDNASLTYIDHFQIRTKERCLNPKRVGPNYFDQT